MKRNETSHYRKFPDWVHWELLNWARWSWEGSYPHPLPSQTCGSVEGEYQPPRYDSCDEPVRRIKADEGMALIVDRAWKSLPDTQRLVLAVEYPRRNDYNWDHGRVGIARKLKIRLTEYEDAFFAAVEKVWRELERGANAVRS